MNRHTTSTLETKGGDIRTVVQQRLVTYIPESKANWRWSCSMMSTASRGLISCCMISSVRRAKGHYNQKDSWSAQQKWWWCDDWCSFTNRFGGGNKKTSSACAWARKTMTKTATDTNDIVVSWLTEITILKTDVSLWPYWRQILLHIASFQRHGRSSVRSSLLNTVFCAFSSSV